MKLASRFTSVVLGAGLALAFVSSAAAQPSAFATDRARITFHADTPMQAIDATTTEGQFTYDAKTGEFNALVPMASFKFQNAQMESNFQTGHVAVSEPGPKDKNGQPTYPNKFAVLSGKLDKTFDTAKEGSTEVTLKGKLTFHGVTKDVAVKGTVTVKGTDLVLAAKMDLAPAEYNVPLPKLAGKELGALMGIVVDATLSAKP